MNMENFLTFINKSTSCFHAVHYLEEELFKNGYERLEESKVWELKKGGAYYVIRNDSSLIAFCIPEETPKAFHVIASHSDHPCFKVKENPEILSEEHYIKINTEKYGGMILSTWLDRPLSIAGRVIVKDELGLVSKLVSIDQDLLVIPNVAVHMNRDMNKGVEYNAQTDMLPLFGEAENKGMLLEMIAGSANVSKTQILGSDLFVYNRDQAKVIGAKGEYILAPRLDDLQCAYASVWGLTQSKPKDAIAVCAVFDNEEVGSATRQGAASTFLKDCFSGICESFGFSEGDYRRMIAESFLISADNAHAVHPNHPEKADPTNKPFLNAGIVMKYHGSQRYTTDAISSAYIKSLCEKLNINVQSYANRSDIAGGSTLGNIVTLQIPMKAADIGMPQLAMHSACETSGTRDMEDFIRLCNAFWEDGICTIRE